MSAGSLADQRWGYAKRLCFWFVCAYFVVYLLPFPLDEIPRLDAVAEAYQELWYRFVPWVGRNILHLGREIVDLPGGSADTTFNYVQLLCFGSIAAAAALLLSLINFRPSTFARIHNWLRIYVRYGLGLTMFGYGVIKTVNTQFPCPDLDRLIQPYGHSSPMGLLWTFMGASPAYTMFTGIAECVGALLLFWRRTTTLGALVIAGVMVNVVMMDFCYDVPAKTFAGHLLLMAFFLLIPDGRRLLHFFVLNRSVAPTALGKPFESAWLNRIALVFKLLFLCATFYWTAMSADEVALRRGSAAPKPPLYGLYEVESFSRNGEEIPFVSTARRWRRAVFNRRGVFAVQWMDDTVRRFGVTDDAEKGTLTLTSRATSETSLLHYTKPNPDEIAMEGDFLGEPINARLRKLPEPEFLLGNRGFHWINERPFNR